MKLFARWKTIARRLQGDIPVLYLAVKHPRTPWYAKLLAAAVVGYALSPIDLIPDFIPVLGYLDDLVLVPLGMVLVFKMIPPDVMHECRARARAHVRYARRIMSVAIGIVGVWLVLGVLAAVWLYGRFI